MTAVGVGAGPGSFAEQYPADEIARQAAALAAVSAAEVARALDRAGEALTIREFIALISPAADPHLDELTAAARRLTAKRFGKTIGLYAPLYLSNYCDSDCVYCGFRADHDVPRRRLTLAELAAEAAALRDAGLQHLLLVAGSDPQLTDIGFLDEAVAQCHRQFASVSIEIEPQDEAAYRRLAARGLDGLVVYQETYHRDRYARLHPAGRKHDYRQRLETPERGARAGLRRVGIGPLLGISDWPYDLVALWHHLHFLQNHHWRTLFTVSLPRLCGAGVAYRPENPVDDRTFTRLVAAVRLAFPDTPIYLSTRERAGLRDGLIGCGVTHLSAGSKTAPGAYSEPTAAAGQFAVDDARSVAEVVAMLRRRGYDPVLKDWEGTLNDRD